MSLRLRSAIRCRLERLHTCLVAGAIAVLAVGCSGDPTVQKQKYLESGNSFFDKGDYSSAIIEYRNAIDEMARSDAAWLERKSLLCRTVTIKVRYSDFTTITRSHSQLPATRDPNALALRACALLERTEAGQRPVRLLGVSVHNLVDPNDGPGDSSLPFAET